MLVTRVRRDGEEIVVLRYLAVFYWLMWPTIALTVLASRTASLPIDVMTWLAWALLIGLALPHWPVIFEAKRRMRTGQITASGSKYSFSNPITYRWPASDNQAAT